MNYKRRSNSNTWVLFFFFSVTTNRGAATIVIYAFIIKKWRYKISFLIQFGIRAKFFTPKTKHFFWKKKPKPGTYY